MTRISAPDFATSDSRSPSPPKLPALQKRSSPHSPRRSSQPSPSLSLSLSAAAKSPAQWIPLDKHPLFPHLAKNNDEDDDVSIGGGGGNLLAWDVATSRLYVWDRVGGCIHRISLRFRDPDVLGSSASTSSVLEAAHPAEILVPDIQIEYPVKYISLNVDGSSLLLVGFRNLNLLHIYDKTSASSQSVYRTTSVASQIFSGQNNGLKVLHTSWHPYSRSHLGILSSDSVFRLYDFSYDLELPEQEFFLQPVLPGKRQNAASICPVAFSFGGQHLWDKFSVFVLFTDGSVYVLCPVVPFGSLCLQTHIQDIYEDINLFGLKSSDPNVVSNSRTALSWLEATFPDVADRSVDGSSILVSRAHPYAPLDASTSLQGPLAKIYLRGETNTPEVLTATDFEGKAVSFLYNNVGKDSVLVIAWSSGQVNVDALADEVQPRWNFGSSPRLHVDSNGCLNGVSMICEPNLQEPSSSKSKFADMGSKIWMTDRIVMDSPPLLRLVIVDLALPRDALNNCHITLFPDPLVAERFYCVHGGGIDLISLQFLPFTNLHPNSDSTPRSPVVEPILSTLGGDSSSSALCGFVAIADLYGDLQVVSLSSSYECIVLEMKSWNELVPFHSDVDKDSVDVKETSTPYIISKELINGPKAVNIPASTTLRSMTADSIDGRSNLHHYIKLFRENYVEYAHKVYVELKEHSAYVQTVINDQKKRLLEAKQLLLKVETKEAGIRDRIYRAFKVYELLDQRLQNFRTLPAANKKPLSKAERDFKTELDGYADVELEALHSAIQALSARLERYSQSSPANKLNASKTKPRGRSNASETQLAQLKSSLETLSIVNKENVKKVKLIEDALKNQK